MAKKPLPCPTVLRLAFIYEPTTGRLFFKKAPNWLFNSTHGANRRNARFAGKEVTSTTGLYVRASVGKYGWFQAHRVAWAIHYGKWPLQHIDHINGDHTDNRIANLRDVPQSINLRNARKRSNNSSGVTGVQLQKASGRWCAFAAGKYLGIFDTKEEAALARGVAERNLGFTPRHGL